jgi:DNA ligase 1
MRRFVETCDAIAATTKKTEKVHLLGEYLKTLSIEDASRAAIFFTGRPFPRREERALGIGGSFLAKLIAALAGKNTEDLGQVYRQHGDLGDMAEQLLRERNASGQVSLSELAAFFEQVPPLRTQSEKLAALKNIFEKASAGEVKYIIKIITGDLRIGLKENLVEEAIAKAFECPLDAVRRANMFTGDIGQTARFAATNDLASASMRLFHPMSSMLATPVETAAEIFTDHSGTMYVEEKYDGIRAQVHKSGNQVKLFSRTLDETTEFPELIAPLASLPGDLVLDGEILAWQGSHPLPFTELQKRLGRKQMDLWTHQEIPARFIAFDLLYQDGELLLDAPLRERRRRLEMIFDQRPLPAVHIAPAKQCDSAEMIEQAFRGSLLNGYEGIVVKSPETPYTPGRRGRFWFKLKEPLATLDVVVTAVEYGHGKRHGMLSDYTFAVRDGNRLLNIGKAYSGLTDAEIREYTGYFVQHTIEDQGFRRIVEPKLVIEVTFNNIQRSNRHNSGYALRFPRILRLRLDKSPGQIDTLERVNELYAKQINHPHQREVSR